MPRFNRLLITGAAGNLGQELRRGLAPLATTIRLTDRADIGATEAHEEAMSCELGDFDAVMKVVEGCDAIVHFGAAPVERPWAEILESSIKGGYNVYEAARRQVLSEAEELLLGEADVTMAGDVEIGKVTKVGIRQPHLARPIPHANSSSLADCPQQIRQAGRVRIPVASALVL